MDRYRMVQLALSPDPEKSVDAVHAVIRLSPNQQKSSVDPH